MDQNLGILALIAEFENDIRRERQMDGIRKARERGYTLRPQASLGARCGQTGEKAAKGRQDSAGDHAADLSIQGVSVPGSLNHGVGWRKADEDHNKIGPDRKMQCQAP